MRIRTLVSAAASLALGAGAMATPQESVTFTGVDSYNTASGGSQAQAGQVRTNSFTGAYVTKKIGVTGTLTRVTSGTFASEARVYVIPPTGTPITLQPFTTNGYTGSINVPAGYSASFATPFAMTAGTWNFRFFESAQDAAFNVADSTWTTITMTLDDGVVPPPSPIAFDFGNVDPASGFNGTSGNIAIAASEVKWFAFNLSSGIDKAALSYLDIDTEGSVLSAANDTNMALYNDQGTVVTSDDDDGSGLLSQLTYGRQERAATGSSLVYNGRDGATRAAGVHYLAVVGKGTTNTFGSNFAVVSNSANTGNVQVHIRAGTYPNNLPETVATVTDLGAISTCPTSFSGTLSANEIKWYKFVLPLNVSVANNNFLDIDTNGSVLTPNQFGPNDTFIAVFNGATGAVVQSDDDDGAGLLSALSFGQTTPTRPATGDGVVNNGRDGALNSGTYYFAAAAYPVTYAAGFDAVSTSAVTGTWSVHIKYGDFNIPAAAEPTSAPSLGTFDPASFGPAGGSATGTATTTITGPGQFKWYKIILTSSADASARTWLDIDTEGSTIGGLATATALYSQATGNPVGSDNDDGSGSLSQLSFGTGGAAARPAVGTGVAYDGRDGNLTAGTYYLAVSPFPGSFNAGYNVQNCGSATGNITINVKAGYSPVVTPTPTYTFAAFSAPAVCASSTLSSPGETLAIGGVNWYKLTVPAIDNANGTYLDITTNGSILATGPTFLNDTLIQLYDNTGVAINFDDESGQDSCSALSYGATSPARANGSTAPLWSARTGPPVRPVTTTSLSSSTTPMPPPTIVSL